MAKKEKIKIKIKLEEVDINFFEGNLEKLVIKMTDLITKYTNIGIENVEFKYKKNGKEGILLYGERDETDSEFNSRKEINDKKLESKIKLLEKLQQEVQELQEYIDENS